MDTIQEAAAILASTEKAIAALATRSAGDGEYDFASVLIDLAKQVRRLGEELLQAPMSDLGDRLDTGQDDDLMPSAIVEPSTPSPKSRSKKKLYPRFLRESTTLVKIGWSKSEKSEYEHKCPKTVVQLLSAEIAKIGQNGKRFSMDDVLPLNNPDDNAQVPMYQAYLALAWFRSLGLVKQYGRQGYSLTTRARFVSTLDASWDALPTR